MNRDFERERMLSYMNRKYGEEFEFVEDYAGQAGKSYIMILAAVSGEPDKKALVRLRREEEREFFEDNYLAWILKGELEEKIGEAAGQCFGECRVDYHVPRFVFPEEFGSDMSPDEFLRNPYSMARFHIYPEQISGSRESWEEKLAAFGKVNGALGYQIRGTVRLAESGQDDGTYSELLFSLDGSGSFRYMRWIGKEDGEA